MRNAVGPAVGCRPSQALQVLLDRRWPDGKAAAKRCRLGQVPSGSGLPGPSPGGVPRAARRGRAMVDIDTGGPRTVSAGAGWGCALAAWWGAVERSSSTSLGRLGRLAQPPGGTMRPIGPMRSPPVITRRSARPAG